MTTDSLTSVTAFAIPGAVLILLALWAGVRRATRVLDLPLARRRALLVRTAAFLGGWLVLASSVGAAGVYRGSADSALPALLLALDVVLPIAIGFTVLAASRTARDLLAATPPHLLIGVQVYRVLGAIFIALLAQGRVPGEFANPAGWGDVLVGVTAPIVAWLYRTDATRWRGLAVLWNVFGLADLALALTLGVLTAPGGLQRLAFDTPNSLVATFPLVLVPTVLVPVSILLHLLTLGSLRARSTGRQLAPA